MTQSATVCHCTARCRLLPAATACPCRQNNLQRIVTHRRERFTEWRTPSEMNVLKCVSIWYKPGSDVRLCSASCTSQVHDSFTNTLITYPRQAISITCVTVRGAQRGLFDWNISVAWLFTNSAVIIFKWFMSTEKYKKLSYRLVTTGQQCISL